MEWTHTFPSNPGAMVNPSFDTAQPLTGCNINEWNGTASTSFDQFSSYNFVPATMEDPGFGFDGWRIPPSLCLKECIQDVPDSRVLGLDQADENFMNSLSDEDIRAMLSTIEPSQQVVHPCNKAQPLDASGISLLEEDLSINSSMISQGSMALDSSTLVNRTRGSITENSILVGGVEKEKIFEAIALLELKAALSRINGRTRICFRDACYRLANDSRVPLDESKNELLEFHFDPFFNPSSRAYEAETVEKETNVLDRAIMNLMFNLLRTEPKEKWSPPSIGKSAESELTRPSQNGIGRVSSEFRPSFTPI